MSQYNRGYHPRAPGANTTIYTGYMGIPGYVQANPNAINTSIVPAQLNLEHLQKYLLERATNYLKEATAYRDSILLKTEVRLPSNTIVAPKGVNLYPIIIGHIPEPSSFEWFLDEPKKCQEDWIQDIVYEIPSKHKFLDSNILPGQGYIVPMELVLRPITLLEERFFFSWYGGFVVENNYLKRNSK